MKLSNTVTLTKIPSIKGRFIITTLTQYTVSLNMAQGKVYNIVYAVHFFSLLSTTSYFKATLGVSAKRQPVIQAVEDKLAVDVLELRASGNKILAVCSGRVDYAMLNLSSSLWDTCAHEAILRALGGEVTDLSGARIVYWSIYFFIE